MKRDADGPSHRTSAVLRGRALPGLVAGLAAAALIACAAGSAQKSTSASVAGEPGAIASPERMEIARLDAAIDAELAKRHQPAAAEPQCSGVGLGCAGAADTATSMGVTPQVQRDPTCTPGPSDTCQDSCTLSDSICSNAGKICSLAKQLGDADAWANEKCAKGTQSCKRAETTCCSCL
ncbi:hypothetical protein BH11MYX3_BH11MYX3_22320 [soil metagenome]